MYSIATYSPLLRLRLLLLLMRMSMMVMLAQTRTLLLDAFQVAIFAGAENASADTIIMLAILPVPMMRC